MEENFDETLEHGSKDDLNKLKSWLFRENVRIITASKDLEKTQKQFLHEKEQFKNEMKSLNRKLSGERKKMEQDRSLFEKQMQILKNGFDQLDIDRRRLEKDKAKLEAQKEIINQSSLDVSYGEVSVFFKGVNSLLALKKRYKDLIKIFHPDNVAGDKEIIQMINSEYDNLKRRFDTEKRA